MKKNSSHFVSIITPAYNCSSYILETYNCLSSQTHSNWEWIVTDDCSSDDTIVILESISEKDSRVRVFKNSENSGAAESRNKSIVNSSGDFIAFLDSDDLWLPNKLETQLNFMDKYNVDFSFTAYSIVDAAGTKTGKVVDTHLEQPITYIDLLKKKATLGCSTVMLRKNSFDDLTMPLIRTGQDYALWLKLLRKHSMAYPIPQVLSSYRILPNSISRNKVKKAMRQWQIYREIEKLSFISSMIYFSFYAYRAVFRK
jgi:teichuronic acid biosynthesis glycosyltransferase TuaG